MTPTKTKTVHPAAAKELDIPEEMVEDIMTYYYEVVREYLSELKGSHLRLDWLGVFYVKERALDKHERSCNNISNWCDTKTQTTKIKNISADVKDQLVKVKKLKEQIAKRHERMRNEREIRKQYKNEKKAKEDLERENDDIESNI